LERALAIHKEMDSSDYSCLADQLYALAALMVDAGKPSLAVEYAMRQSHWSKWQGMHLIELTWYVLIGTVE